VAPQFFVSTIDQVIWPSLSTLIGASFPQLNFIVGAVFLHESQGNKFFRMSGVRLENECGKKKSGQRVVALQWTATARAVMKRQK